MSPDGTLILDDLNPEDNPNHDAFEEFFRRPDGTEVPVLRDEAGHVIGPSDLIPDNVIVVSGVRVKVMTLTEYVTHLLVDTEPAPDRSTNL